jgi:hypothetical protein
MAKGRIGTAKMWLRAGIALASSALLLGGVFAVGANASAQARAAVTPTSGALITLPPNRIADSRIWDSLITFRGQEQEDLQVAGRGGVPLVGAASVILNVTAVDPQDAGYVTVWPLGIARPTASNLNFYPNHNIANTVIVGLSDDGTISLFNGSSAALDIVVDVEGYVPA